MPWGAPLSLIGDSASEVAEAQRMLVRIGIDELQGAATGSAEDLSAGTPTSSYPQRTFAELPEGIVAADQATDTDAVILDVRRDDEYAGGYIPGAAHIPLHNLLETARRPATRAAVGALRRRVPLIDRREPARPRGRDVVLIDDDYDNAVAAGITTNAKTD